MSQPVRTIPSDSWRTESRKEPRVSRVVHHGEMRIKQLMAVRLPLTQLVLFALAFASVFVLVYVLTVRTTEGRLLGDASLRGALLTNSRFTGTVDRVLDVVSVASLLAALAVIAVIALVRLARLQGLAAITVLVGSNLSTLILKNYILDRPDVGIREVTPATLNSLPSGHATAAFSAVAALLFVLPRPWRLTTAVVGTMYATLTALATMSAGWHRASDSIAAFLLVGVWSMAAAAFLVAAGDTRPSGDPPNMDPVPLRRWLEAATVGCLALGVTIGLALSAVAPVRDSTVGSSVAFLAGGCLIAGTSTAVLIAVLSALNLNDQGPAPVDT